MKPTRALHDLGQSLWLDNITRELLSSGTLQRYIDELSVTGLTSNPTIFDHAIRNSATYDADISHKTSAGKSGEDLFFGLALADLTRAAELFRPVFERTDGVDGWVSLEVSPLLAHDTNSTLAAARDLHRRGGKPNLFIKIPGTSEGVERVTVKTNSAVPEWRSCLLTSLMLIRGSSSRMVPMPWPSPMTAPTGWLRLTTKVSFGSPRRSPSMSTVTVWVLSPGAKVTIPDVVW